MRISSVYAQFPYMHNFCIWNLYISSFMYLHRMCTNFIYINFTYTEIVHIWKICAYTKIVHIQNICAYLPYIPNFSICAYLPYMHVVYVSASYMRKFHIQKLHIYGNCAYTKDMRISSLYAQFPYMPNLCIWNLRIYDADT